MSYRVLVACDTIEPAILYLQQFGYEIRYQRSYDRNSTLRDLQDCDAFLMDEGICDAEFLQNTPRLKVIGKESVGLDSIDLATAEKLGIWVTNARDSNARSVAEHTIALILGCAKNLVCMDQMTRQGKWPRRQLPTLDLYQKTLGIIGLGSIGSLVAQIAHDAFGMKIIFYDPFTSSLQHSDYRAASSLCELLSSSDYVSLHIPLLPETYHLIGMNQLRAMKPSAFLINCARGDIVDSDALYQALTNGIIKGAALDALPQEPLCPDNPLAGLTNVIFSPHNAAFTSDTITRMWMYAAEGIHEVLSGSLPTRPGNHPLYPRLNGVITT